MRSSALSREPLVHFFLLGSVLFGLYGWIRGWHRQPSPTELAGLIDDWVREEILVRIDSTIQ